MTRPMSALLAGLFFGVGLGVGGMTQPSKVVGFLDFFGDWDPSLIFVMGGAVGIHALLYRWVTRRNSPLVADAFQIPARKDINVPLVIGSALFGVGWGLGGYCPGPGLASLPTLGGEALTFVAAMVVGIAGHDHWRSRNESKI